MAKPSKPANKPVVTMTRKKMKAVKGGSGTKFTSLDGIKGESMDQKHPGG